MYFSFFPFMGIHKCCYPPGLSSSNVLCFIAIVAILSFEIIIIKCFFIFFWMSSFHSRTLLQATLALSLVVSSLTSGMLWLFHIFCSDTPIACPLFNLVRNSVVHSPSSVVRAQGTGTYRPTPVAYSEWVCGTLCRRSPLPWSCRRCWVGYAYLRLIQFRWSASSCSSA